MMHAAIGCTCYIYPLKISFSFSLMSKACSSHIPDLLDFSCQHLKREIAFRYWAKIRWHFARLNRKIVLLFNKIVDKAHLHLEKLWLCIMCIAVFKWILFRLKSYLGKWDTLQFATFFIFVTLKAPKGPPGHLRLRQLEGTSPPIFPP